MAKRGGKYSHVIDSLPKLPSVEPERRDLFDAVRTSILGPPSDDDPSPIDPNALVEEISSLIKHLYRIELRAAAGKPWASEFARVYAELRGIKNKMAEWESSINLLLDVYQVLMTDQFEVEGISSLRLANGQPVSTFIEPYASVSDKEAYRLWSIRQGLERDMHLPWQKTNALTKEMLLAGEEPPPGVEIFAKTKVRLGSE